MQDRPTNTRQYNQVLTKFHSSICTRVCNTYTLIINGNLPMTLLVSLIDICPVSKRILREDGPGELGRDLAGAYGVLKLGFVVK